MNLAFIKAMLKEFAKDYDPNKDPDENPDFDIHANSGGQIDDAYRLGYTNGEGSTAVYILKLLND